MIAFCDRHQDGLAHSLRLLAKRLGIEIYFPIGESWFTQGYFKIAEPYQNNPDTIKQYLSLDQRYKPVDGTLPLNTITDIKPTHYEIEDKAHGDILKSITFEQFLTMDIDIVIASIPSHVPAYKELITHYKPKAKLIYQAGNVFQETREILQEGNINFLGSVKEFPLPASVHGIFYHQEMDIVPYVKPTGEKNIYSFVHLLPQRELFFLLQRELSDFIMQAFGANTPGGNIDGVRNVYRKMQEAMWGFHWKPGADGFGHVIYSWGMVGRPVLINYMEYKNNLAGELLIPDKTCIALDNPNLEEIIKKIRYFSLPEIYAQMSLMMYNKFNEKVNYEEEAQSLRRFIENLL